MKHPRSSRQRYRGFVQDYKLRRLDEATDAQGKKPQELMNARGGYYAMVRRQIESEDKTVEEILS